MFVVIVWWWNFVWFGYRLFRERLSIVVVVFVEYERFRKVEEYCWNEYVKFLIFCFFD